MSKESLQTKWNGITQHWEVFLSMKNNSLNRETIDLVEEINRKQGAQHIGSLEETDKIRNYLQDDPVYKKVQKQLDDNRRAIFRGEKQTPEAGFFLQSSLSLLGASLAVPVISTAVDMGFKKYQKDSNLELSKGSIYDQSVAVFVVTLIVSVIGLGMNYWLSHKKHHEIMDANNAHKTIDELLGRLDTIRNEVQLKNAAIEKIDAFLAKQMINDEDLKNKIIAALDNDDNIETWISVNRNTSQLRIEGGDYIEELKTSFVKKYGHEKANLAAEISEINNLHELLTYIDTNMLTSQIPHWERRLPKAFIAQELAQLLQGKYLQLENNQASSSSSNNVHAFHHILKVPINDTPRNSL